MQFIQINQCQILIVVGLKPTRIDRQIVFMQPLQFSKYTVAVRMRPPLTESSPLSFTIPTSKSITQHRPSSLVTYSFDQVFDPLKTNEDIYESIRTFLERGFTQKLHSTILAYGQTGSGKTHTLLGHDKNGLIHYIGNQLFHNEQKYRITCSAIQIYNQKALDLIGNSQIRLLDDAKGNMIVEGMELKEIQTVSEFEGFLKTVSKNKVIGSSYIHNESSRSHVLMTLRVNGVHVNVVDLCGNEVLTYNFNQKQRTETNNINLSLFTLNTVLADICDSKNKHIPYRNSILTRLLKNSLSSQNTCQIYMICTISPETDHIEMSRRTLRFGQLAIEIDQNLVQENVVNLSEQKRESKKVKNIVDLKLEPEESGALKFKWGVERISINSETVKVYKLNWDSEHKETIVFLHAYGYYCDGTDWNTFVNLILKSYPKIRMLSLDFPGFGESTGKKFTSRSEKFNDKDQPIAFMKTLFSQLKLSSPKKLTLVGYDLGGAISLSCCLDPGLSKLIENVICFHPTWTDSIQNLSPISQRVLLLWVKGETFHLLSAGEKMSKTMKNSTLYRLNIGVFKEDQVGGYYDKYSKAMCRIICEFLGESKGIEMKMKSDHISQRGKVTEIVIESSVTKEEQRLQKVLESIKEYFSSIKQGSHKAIYQSLMRTSESTPKNTRLAGNLWELSPTTLTFDTLLKLGLVKQPSEEFTQMINKCPRYLVGRQLQVKTTVELNMLKEHQYLKYIKDGDLAATHFAWVSKDQTSEEILDSRKIKVDVLSVDDKTQTISLDLDKVLQLNQPTQFSIVNGDYIFEDSVTSKYSSLFLKLKMYECLYHTTPLISRLSSLTNNPSELLKTQKEIASLVVKQIDLRHLVHEGIDNTRYTGTDVGRLAYRGQGNCHHLASVAAALLLPFGKLCGWDVVFRAGSCLKTGREIDNEGNPIQGWNGKPKLNVEDHTWLQVVFRPSMRSYVFDPSFDLWNYQLQKMYAPYQFHISGKPQCVYEKRQIKVPQHLFGPN